MRVEIPLHDLALFACRRAAWPGANRQFRGLGGEEGYIDPKALDVIVETYEPAFAG